MAMRAVEPGLAQPGARAAAAHDRRPAAVGGRPGPGRALRGRDLDRRRGALHAVDLSEPRPLSRPSSGPKATDAELLRVGRLAAGPAGAGWASLLALVLPSVASALKLFYGDHDRGALHAAAGGPPVAPSRGRPRPSRDRRVDPDDRRAPARAGRHGRLARGCPSVAGMVLAGLVFATAWVGPKAANGWTAAAGASIDSGGSMSEIDRRGFSAALAAGLSGAWPASRARGGRGTRMEAPAGPGRRAHRRPRPARRPLHRHASADRLHGRRGRGRGGLRGGRARGGPGHARDRPARPGEQRPAGPRGRALRRVGLRPRRRDRGRALPRGEGHRVPGGGREGADRARRDPVRPRDRRLEDPARRDRGLRGRARRLGRAGGRRAASAPARGRRSASCSAPPRP